MSFTNRNDPIERLLADEEAADHAEATRRGERAQRVADCAVRAIMADVGWSGRDSEITHAAIVRAVCDEFYENKAVDLPAKKTS